MASKIWPDPNYLEPVNVTLFGERLIVDVIKNLEMTSSRITQMGPKSINKSPFKRQKKRHRESEEKAM